MDCSGQEAVASGLGAAPQRVDVAQAHELAVDEVELVRAGAWRGRRGRRSVDEVELVWTGGLARQEWQL